jgi:hypothetical protein
MQILSILAALLIRMPRSELWPTKVQGVLLFLSKQEIKNNKLERDAFGELDHRSCSVLLH